MAVVVLYEHSGFKGDQITLTGSDRNLNDNSGWFDWNPNDEISSFKVLSGYVQFHQHADYKGWESPVFGVGEYRWVEAVGIGNDAISSVEVWG
jgi:hypothetical protein